MNQEASTKLALLLRSLAEVPDDELARVLAIFRPMHVVKGELFVRAGEVPEQIAFLDAGLMRLFYIRADGEEFTKSFLPEGEIVGAYSALLRREPSRLWIDALEDSSLLAAPYREYTRLAEIHPCWQIINRKIAEALFIKKEQREASLLLDNAETRYRTFLAEYPNLEHRLKQHQIASYLGITSVSLSRIRARMGLT